VRWREAVEYLQTAYRVSERRVCAVSTFHRSTHRYRTVLSLFSVENGIQAGVIVHFHLAVDPEPFFSPHQFPRK